MSLTERFKLRHSRWKELKKEYSFFKQVRTWNFPAEEISKDAKFDSKIYWPCQRDIDTMRQINIF